LQTAGIGLDYRLSSARDAWHESRDGKPTESVMSESYIQKQLNQIDVNIEEAQRLIRVQNELITQRLCRGNDTSEEKTKAGDLRLALAEMEKSRKSTASLSARSDAYLNRLPSRLT
jgi:hypothetical protein